MPDAHGGTSHETRVTIWLQQRSYPTCGLVEALHNTHRKKALFCFCAPDLAQEAPAGRIASNRKTPAALPVIPPSVAAAAIIAPNCAIAPVINFHSGAIRPTLDGLQRGSGPIHAKWVRGVNLRCLQRLRRFPSVSLFCQRLTGSPRPS